jgi:hypothetical protein
MTDNQIIINHLLSVEAWANGLLKESRRARLLLEKGSVSTPAANSNMDEQVAAAVSKFRQRLGRKSKK